MKLFIFVVLLYFGDANGFAIIHPNNDNTVLDSTCNGYSSTTNMTTDVMQNVYFAIDYQFTNESFIVTFTDFIARTLNVSSPAYIKLHSFSLDLGWQECEVFSCDDGSQFEPKSFALKLSKLNTYDLTFQLHPDFWDDNVRLYTVMTSKSHVVTEPAVSSQNPCQFFTAQTEFTFSRINFCCKA